MSKMKRIRVRNREKREGVQARRDFRKFCRKYYPKMREPTDQHLIGIPSDFSMENTVRLFRRSQARIFAMVRKETNIVIGSVN